MGLAASAARLAGDSGGAKPMWPPPSTLAGSATITARACTVPEVVTTSMRWPASGRRIDAQHPCAEPHRHLRAKARDRRADAAVERLGNRERRLVGEAKEGQLIGGRHRMEDLRGIGAGKPGGDLPGERRHLVAVFA